MKPNISHQKNRSRRIVKEPIDRVHIGCLFHFCCEFTPKLCSNLAHTLLNVYNDEPLAPFRVSNRNDPFSSSKLRKLVKPANKSKRKQIEKLRKATNKSDGMQS